ncbi:MAG: bifunctional acetate--CoA ligase family protein/GNAT family N-acetyltransferase [Vampirovibrionales bacterium]|nr:bifunctional acetate--CoA ligase family protein/GNAT family N-acetyltransferase [Vampirovibrionales bacterium]
MDSGSPLDAIFLPQNVAVIGATEKQGSVGRTLLWNLLSSPFGGTVFPVNPKRKNVLGIQAFPSIADVPEPVDLAVIVTPAATAPGLVKDCVAAGVKGCVIISAGFKEVGPEGEKLEQEILATARSANMRIIGPNCLGVMNPVTGLNATFATTIAQKGQVGFISQSGALGTAVLDWSLQTNLGFSSFISIGSMLDVDWGDLIYYLGDDPNTESIVIYMESIGNARSFMSAAREVALSKPIIVIKPGRTEGAAKAAASHTGSMTGSDEILDAAFRRCGVLRVDSIEELFSMAEVLGKQPTPKGSRLTILTNAGGPGVLATDSLLGNRGELAMPRPDTMKALNEILPPQWSHNNPVDVLGDASPERYAQALDVCLDDADSDGLLVILTPQAMTSPTPTAKLLAETVQRRAVEKPVLASWMGGQDVAEGEAILNDAGIPTFPYPDDAAKAFAMMCRRGRNMRLLYETPSLASHWTLEDAQRQGLEDILNSARKGGRTILTEWESKQILSAYNIPTVATEIARSADEAARAADAIGYPVVIKLHSETITHKTDVGGVKLNLHNADAVRKAYQEMHASVTQRHGKPSDFLGVTVQPMVKLDGYELIIGSSIDPQFGPVLVFGSGGQLVEVFKDISHGLPPLNSTLARRMIERTKIYHALQGVRGRAPVNQSALEELIVRFSQLVVEQPWIKEIEINPLLASDSHLTALDARVILHEANVDLSTAPAPSIRPYPEQYVGSYKIKDGAPLVIRPIRPEDEPLMKTFHQLLSDQTIVDLYSRLVPLGERTAHERLSRVTSNDYDREIALIALEADPKTGEQSIVGIARLSKRRVASQEARFRVLIADRLQGKGLGKELLRRLIEIGRQEKLTMIKGEILNKNDRMKAICESFGFEIRPQSGRDQMTAELDLTRAPAACR